MGFLSGVLGAVKNEDAVKTYDNYISDPEKGLNKVIEKLNTKIGTGRDGLAESVGAVKRWLEGYEKEVKEKTGNVIIELSWLQDNLSGKYFNRIRFSQKLGEQLEKWKTTLGDIEQDVTHIESNVNMLDSKLKTALLHEIKVVGKSVQVMKDSAGYTFLTDQVRKVDDELENQHKIIINHMNGQSEMVDDTVTRSFGEIGVKLKELNETKGAQFKRIRGAVMAAREFFVNSNSDFYRVYMNGIDSIIHNINIEVNAIYGSLQARKDELINLVTQAQGHFAEIQKEVGEVSSDKKSGIMGKWHNLKEKIVTELINRYILDSNNKIIGLMSIDKGINDYALKFKQSNTFGSVVEEWIRSILDGDYFVKECLDGYVEQRGTNFNAEYRDAQRNHATRELLNRKISAKFREHLMSGVINDAIQAFAQADVEDSDIATNVENVHKVCSNFATLLENKIKGKEEVDHQTYNKINLYSSEIAKTIEGSDGLGLQPVGADSDESYDLTEAIASTLPALVTTSRQFAFEFQRFTASSKIVNLKEAIAKVNDLSNLVSDGSNQLGDEINKALTAVKKQIDSLQKLLEQQKGSIHDSLRELQTAVIDKLNDVKKPGGMIDAHNNAAADLMHKLRIEVSDKIAYIDNKLQEADTNLVTAIRIAQSTLDKAYRNTKDAVANLKEDILRVTNQAFYEVSKHVKKLFAEQHIADLSALRTLVTKQLKNVEWIIDKDLRNGVKAFLKKMNENAQHLGTFEEQLQKDNHSKFRYATTHLRPYFNDILQFIGIHVTTLPPADQSKKVNDIKERLDKMLDHFDNHDKHRLFNFDHQFVKLHASLKTSVSSLSPSRFAGHEHPLLLDTLKDGLTMFSEQLDRAYVNEYCGSAPIDKWVTDDPKRKKSEKPSTSDDNTILTTDGRNGARVCVTVVYTLYQYLYELFYTGARNWKKYTIKGEAGKYDNALQKYLKRSGYELCNLDSTLTTLGVTGRLFNGFQHYGEFNKDPSEFNSMEACIDYFRRQDGPVVKIFNFLETYNEMCHFTHIPKPRSPCSVYEMCVWLTGLPYRRVYDSLLHDVLPSLLEDPNADDAGDEEITVTFTAVDSLAAYPQPIKYNDVANALTHICSKSYDVITTVVGHGDAETHYASEYCDNSFKLRYPNNPSACLDMLLDILRRLFAVFNFLQSQCRLTVQHNGWRDCYYGRDVNSTKQPCKEHSKCKPSCQPNSQPKCQPTCEPNCQPTSPLQSYLNDCLPGHLPHQLTDVGCSYKCSSCTKCTPGMPCLTPLGFRAFSGSTKTGRDICDIIEEFFYQVKSTCLFGLIPKPPKTLAEHFSFSLSLAKEWQSNRKHALKDEIHSSIDSVSISLCKTPHEFTSAISNAYGSSQSDHGAFHPTAESADVSSLSMQIKCAGNQCAPYLYSLYDDVYSHIALKTSGACLSWALYLPWDFHNYLQNLLKAIKEIFCQDWGCRGCLRGDSCKKGSHGEEKSPCHCTSIVDCKGVSSTLYNYGFAFGNAAALCAKQSTKTCANFCDQLNKVINSKYFTKLFDECDHFLFTIRAPFIWLNVALWLLSFLYLIHIMVIRLDLLHIKSHLHSPSSHRIAAQSLLAAGRVNKLGRVFYLQP